MPRAVDAQPSLWVATIGHRFPDASIEAEALKGTGVDVRWLGGLPKQAAVDAARDADAVLLGATFSLEVDALRRFRRCRVIVRYGVGVDNIDIAGAAQLGIIVCNVPDYGIEEVADHALALLLLFARRLNVWGSAARDGLWGATLPRVVLRRLSQTTLGVIGAGRIGRAVIRRTTAIWGRVLAYDPWVSGDDLAAIGAQKAELGDLLAESDFITIHVPLTAQTRGLLSAERLRLTKDGVVIVNCSRGDVVDEHALSQAIVEGKVSGAGLDVFAVEPPSLDGLLARPQVWPTPHVAWLSEESVRDLRWRAAEEAGRILRGEAPRYRVDATEFETR